MTKARLAAGLTAAVLLGGGALTAMRLVGPPRDRAAELVPSGSPFYANAFLDPSTRQKLALRDLVERLRPPRAPRDGGELVGSIVDGVLSDTGLTFADHVEPWLGDEVGVFVTAGSGGGPAGVLLAAEDPDAAFAAVERARAERGVSTVTRSHEGAAYQVDEHGAAAAIVDGFLVLGDARAVRAAMDAAQGDSLAETPAFRDSLEGLPADRLGLVYAADGLTGLGPRPFGAPLIPPLVGSGAPTAIAISARPDALILSTSISSGVDPLVGLLGAPGASLLERMGVSFGAEDTGRAAPTGATLVEVDGIRKASRGLDEGYSPAAYFDVPGLLRLVDALGATSNVPYRQEVRPFLESLSYVVVGSDDDGARTRLEVVIGTG